MKSNLAHERLDPQGEVVQFPKKERQAMSKKEEGYTPLPNFICDEGYLAALSGESIKCLILLNRHINGFHEKNKAIGEALVMKLTGFKDKRTVRKNMAELAKYKLVNIAKTLGKATTYSVTFEDRLSPELVALNATGALNVGTSNATSVGTSDVTTTSDIKCHSVKEIYLKETIKEKRSSSENPKFEVQKNVIASYVTYFMNDPKYYSLFELESSYSVNTDFINQALASYPSLDLKIDNFSTMFDEMRQWSLTTNAGKKQPQQWMNTWLNWVKNNAHKFTVKPKQTFISAKPTTALQATKDQWASERFAQQKNSTVIDVNQDQVLIGGEREHF